MKNIISLINQKCIETKQFNNTGNMNCNYNKITSMNNKQTFLKTLNKNN